MKKMEIPRGELNVLPKGRGGCEFCEKVDTGHNPQGIWVCDEHKDMMLILKCPVCSLDLSIQVGGFPLQVFWCVVHRGFSGDELRKDSRIDEKGNIQPYWSEENIKARGKRAEEMSRKYYSKKLLVNGYMKA